MEKKWFRKLTPEQRQYMESLEPIWDDVLEYFKELWKVTDLYGHHPKQIFEMVVRFYDFKHLDTPNINNLNDKIKTLLRDKKLELLGI